MSPSRSYQGRFWGPIPERNYATIARRHDIFFLLTILQKKKINSQFFKYNKVLENYLNKFQLY